MRLRVHIAIAAGLALAGIGVTLGVFFATRGEDEPPERLPSMAMSGVVVRPDGTPAAGVLVRWRADLWRDPEYDAKLEKPSTVSGIDGRFTLEFEGYSWSGHVEAVAGEQTVARAEAYQRAYGYVAVLVVPTEPVPRAPLRLTVVREDGTTCYPAWVLARNGTSTADGMTDRAGQVVVHLAPGPNGLYAWDDHTCGAVLVDVAPGGGDARVVIGGGTVEARVEGRDGDAATYAVELSPVLWTTHPVTGRRVPVPFDGLEGQDDGRYVTVSCMEVMAGWRRTTVRAPGDARFGGVGGSAAWRIGCVDAPTDDRVGRVEVQIGGPPAVLDVGAFVDASSIAVEAVDAAGVRQTWPMRRIRPEARSEAAEGFLWLRRPGVAPTVLRLIRDPSDEARLVADAVDEPPVARGAYEAEVRLRGFRPARVDGTVIVPTAQPLRVLVQPGVTVTGSVRRTDGVTVAEGRLWLHRDGVREAEAAVKSVTVVDERFQLEDVAPGTYDVVVADAGRPRCVGERLVAPEGARRVEHDVVTRPGARVVVMFAAGARLTSDVSLRIVPSGGGAAIRFARTADELTRVNPWGGPAAFPVLDGFPPGRYTLEGTWDGQPMPSRTIDLAAGATAVVALPLK